jgi:hypothetical protein
MNRKNFLLGTTAGFSGLFFLPKADTTQPAQKRPDPYNLDLVKEFVIAGHGNLPKTQSMLADHPNLAFAKFDWGAATSRPRSKGQVIWGGKISPNS